MPTQLQFRRGTTAQNNNFTGAAGEISIDETLDTIRVHDGTTAGGYELTQNAATQTLTNKTLTSPTINSGTVGTALTFNAQADVRFADSDSSNWVAFQGAATIASNITWTLPSTDGSSGQALVTDGSGTLSWAAAGATISSDTTTNSNFLLYFASSTSGALTAVKQDSGLTYNPSTGTMTASTFSGALSGNATTATALATGRTITLNGDVTGTSGSFDGSTNVTLTATIAANSVALGTDTTGNYVATGAVSGVGLSGSSSSEGGTFTVTSNATSANTANTIVSRDGSGNFSAGVITATTTAARYADLAERYTADADYEPGTVLCLGGEAEVTQSTKALDRKVIGIVSTAPAHIMNSELEGGVAVALTGRVPCKVIGAVSKGDMLVSSSTPGHAMAWKDEGDPPYGTVIGKSIENKDSSDAGVIEVAAGIK